MAGFDPYSILGISRNALPEEIKKAYRSLAKIHHPDVNPGNKNAEIEFKKLNEAYQILSDPKKRLEFDLTTLNNPNDLISEIFGSKWWKGGPVRAPKEPSYEAKNVYVYEEDIETRPGEDVEVVLEIELEEAVKGCEKTVSFKDQNFPVCNKCDGVGCQKGTTQTSFKCSICSGLGYGIGFSKGRNKKIKCLSCNGKGHTFVKPCKECEGSGHIQATKEVKINIPDGVDHGLRLRCAGCGIAGVNSPPGDLHVVIHIKPHQRFTRSGKDLLINHNISFIEAIRGGRSHIEGLFKERIEFDIDPGIQSGEFVVFEGKGIRSRLGFPPGNMIVMIMVQIPKALSPRAMKLIEELEKELYPMTYESNINFDDI